MSQASAVRALRSSAFGRLRPNFGRTALVAGAALDAERPGPVAEGDPVRRQERPRARVVPAVVRIEAHGRDTHASRAHAAEVRLPRSVVRRPGLANEGRAE